jgi:hypothetical protein
MQTDMAFVIAKGDPRREVVAVMPGHAGTNEWVDSCTCYVHLGQHSAASIQHIMDDYEDASCTEYADLLYELQCIGYSVNVIPAYRVGDLEYVNSRRDDCCVN